MLIVLSAQEVKLVAVESRVKLTEPVGVVDAEDAGESVTVAVQGRPTLTRTDGEAQSKLVTVVWTLTLRLNPPWLPEWSVSPAYAPLIDWATVEEGV